VNRGASVSVSHASQAERLQGRKVRGGLGNASGFKEPDNSCCIQLNFFICMDKNLKDKSS
jgi:hypothetical protein